MTANLDTKALRALEAKATPGPWGKTPFEEKNDVCIWSPEGKWLANVGNWGNCQLVVEGENGPDVMEHPDIERIETGHDANAEFMVAIRNAAPALLDAAEERDKYRTAANVLCAAHIGLPQASCPVCERDALRAELSWIDSVLARRPALDKPTRAANIERAINVAKQADALKAEVAKLQLSASDVEFHGNEQIKALRSEVERLREALLSIERRVPDVWAGEIARAALRSANGEVQS